MALKVQSSFSTGELDPVLHERTTLAKFQNGLKTARNVVVGKTGSVLSRQGRQLFIAAKLADREIKLYSPPRSGYLLEWGHQYVRIYNSVRTLLYDSAHALTEDDLVSMHFETTGNYVYVFCDTKETLRLNYLTGVFSTAADIVTYPIAGTLVTVTPGATAPTGYALDYAVTYVKDGQESVAYMVAAGSMPILVAESNTVDITIAAQAITGVTEARFYRRPQSGGVFGYIGSSSNLFNSGGNKHSSFIDLGQDADYSHSPPAPIAAPAVAPTYQSSTGCIYQQRLVITEVTDREAIMASRPGLITNFTRDYPLNSDSALKFKSGASGKAEVLRLIEKDGLVAFTSRGVWLHSGALSPTNISMVKKGPWVIKEAIEPIDVSGGIFFVDVATNTIRNLVWSDQLSGFNGQEISLFSNHIFATREVVSWALQEGNFPLLWVVFDDGTFASFTYEFDHEMKAWTRHDSADVLVEGVCATGVADLTYFVVNKDGTRYIERTMPRHVPAATLASDPQADKNPSVAFMDAMVTLRTLLNDSLAGADVFTMAPVVAGDWEGEITLDCGTSAIFTAVVAAVGEVFRVFDEDGSEIDLEVTARASNNSITVQPNIVFPEYAAVEPRIYRTYDEVTGLSHMEGEAVSIVADGYVIASPYNNIENYEDCVVFGGRVELGARYAIIHVGRPIIADVETLDIATVEQAPTLVESMTVNKLNIKVNDTRSLYVGPKFPDGDMVNSPGEGVPAMEPLKNYEIDYSQDEPIIGNRHPRPETRRHDLTLPGDWKSNGRICMRSVDPLHFQVLSVIPDLDIERRSDR